MIKIIMPNVKIIINKVRAVKEYKDQQGNIRRIPMSRNPDEVNEEWDKLDDYCIKTFGFRYIDLSAKDYFSHEKYPFGGPPRAVHYTKDFYENFIMELSSIAVQDLQENLYKLIYPEFSINQIDNSNFERGKDHWSFWQNNFHIVKDRVEINNNGIKQGKYNLILSNPIKVKKGEVYNLSFKVYIGGNIEFDGDEIIFYLIIFDHPTKNLQEDSVWYKNIEYSNYTNANVRDEWATVKYEFTAQNNGFLKVGPGITKNGHVIWKDIYLTSEVVNNLSWCPSYKDVMSNINFEKIQNLLEMPKSPDKRKEMEILLKISEYECRMDWYESTINEYKHKVEEYESTIKEYKNSHSWKITLPLRKTVYILKNLRKSVSSK